MQVPANATTIPDGAKISSEKPYMSTGNVLGGSVFGKTNAAGGAKSQLPSFAAVLTGESAGVESAEVSAEVEDRKAQPAFKNEDGRKQLSEKNFNLAAEDIRNAAGHDLQAEAKIGQDTAHAYPHAAITKTKKSKEARHPAEAGMQEKKYNHGGSDLPQVGNTVVPAPAPVVGPEIAPRPPEKLHPTLSAGPPAPTVNLQVASQAEHAAGETALQVPGKEEEQPATSKAVAASQSPVEVSFAESKLPFQISPKADAAPPAGPEPAPVAAGIEKAQMTEFTAQKSVSRSKAEDKTAAGALRLAPNAPVASAVTDAQRIASGIAAAPPVARIADAGDAAMKSNTLSMETSNAFQRLDAGEAPPALLHSSAHSVAVGIHDPVLGWLEVQTQNSAGHLSATLTADSSGAHASLAADIPAMTQYLADRNIAVHSLNVGTQGGASAGGEAQTGSGQARQQQEPARNENVLRESERPARQVAADVLPLPVSLRNSRISVRA